MRLFRTILRYSDRRVLLAAMLLAALAGGGTTALLAVVHQGIFLWNPAGEADLVAAFVALTVVITLSRFGAANRPESLSAGLSGGVNFAYGF